MPHSLSGSIEGVPERFVPEEMRGQLVEAEHVARYLWAARHVAGARTLDAGCGTGYGSVILSEAGAKEVIGIDKAVPVIEAAAESAPPGVRFEAGDIAAMAHPPGSFDRVICFEAIEHVEDPDRVLDEFKRVLQPDGLLIISSPNRNRYTPGNPHHRHEYTPDELESALLDRFEEVRIIQQHAMIASVVSRELSEGVLRAAVVKSFVAATEGDEVYTLAVAGRKLPEPAPPLVSLTSNFEVRYWLDRFGEQRNELRELDLLRDQVEDLRRERNEVIALLSEREREISQIQPLRQQIEAGEARLAEERSEHEHEIGARLDEIKALEGELLRTRDTLQSVLGSASWRLTAPIRAAKRLLERS